MTRSHKYNDRDHAGLADGSAAAEEHLPRYFAKSGHVDVDPKKIKKEGGGKGNWGHIGAEAHDSGYRFTQTRRRSNSSTNGNAMADFKTKFEALEADPVFEEETMGAALEKGASRSSERSEGSDSVASQDEEDGAK